MDADAIRRVDGLARRGFSYRPDGEADTWRSHAEAVLAGQAWSGDCDDLTSTVLDLLGRDGLALDRRFRLLLAVEGEGVDHMAACAIDEAGRFWIVGDTAAPAYAAPAQGQVLFHQRLDEWRGDGHPLWREDAPYA